jgi:hypothetical protein
MIISRFLPKPTLPLIAIAMISVACTNEESPPAPVDAVTERWTRLFGQLNPIL